MSRQKSLNPKLDMPKHPINPAIAESAAIFHSRAFMKSVHEKQGMVKSAMKPPFKEGFIASQQITIPRGRRIPRSLYR
jgi:hypothetical protein